MQYNGDVYFLHTSRPTETETDGTQDNVLEKDTKLPEKREKTDLLDGSRFRRASPSNSELLQPQHAPSVPLRKPRHCALALRGSLDAPQHVLRPRYIKQAIGADAHLDLEPTARVKVLAVIRSSWGLITAGQGS